jgi:hypothetical protein
MPVPGYHVDREIFLKFFRRNSVKKFPEFFLASHADILKKN